MMNLKFCMALLIIFFANLTANAADFPNNQKIIDEVVKEFQTYSKSPHCTYHEKAVSDYMVQKYKNIGANVIQDSYGNVIADLPATNGYENKPLILIQGHMDMVCAHSNDFDPIMFPITTVINDNILKTDGKSSLGADDMINVAAINWLFENQKFNHAPIRFIWTVQEETGLVGASKIDAKFVKDAKYLINLDGFKLGRIVVGSAGGRREMYSSEVLYSAQKNNSALIITVSGLQGGHSGYDINKQRANAIKILGSVLYSESQKYDIQLADINGGEAHNVIPRNASAILVVPKSDVNKIINDIKVYNERIQSAYNVYDSKITMNIQKTKLPKSVLDKNSQDNIINFINLLDNGIFENMQMYPHLVDTSSNLGRIYIENNKVHITLMLRNSDNIFREIMVNNHKIAASLCNMNSSVTQYESWKPIKNNPLAKIFIDAYQSISGEKAELTAEHIGVEPSAFLEKNPDLIAISTGITIKDAHSLNEQCSISDIPTFVKMMKLSIQKISERHE